MCQINKKVEKVWESGNVRAIPAPTFPPPVGNGSVTRRGLDRKVLSRSTSGMSLSGILCSSLGNRHEKVSKIP